ncbi:hypothetical protein [Devosia sp. UYZn731]|uniref:hypothetical protein n=1 Tax=Devosia sp. UYZn731 TaxID=3156345 RepID=UPI0033928A4A
MPILTLREYIVAGMQVQVGCMGGCGHRHKIDFQKLMDIYGPDMDAVEALRAGTRCRHCGAGTMFVTYPYTG